MATPTPSHPSHPTSASKKTTGHGVSTPSFSSPAPRSVPSPATTRKDQAGKTPMNHHTGSSQGSKTLSSTPMVHSLSQQGNSFSSSPGANMLGYGTPPIGLGVEGITPSGLNMSTPGMGGIAMVTSLSELGLTSSLGSQKPNEDEQRKARMRKILKSIGTRKGRVSEEGIARVSRRVGFTNDIDTEKLSREDQARKVGNRKIAIAGNKLIMDVDLRNHIPQSVEVVFDTQNEHLAGQADATGKLLLHDLGVQSGVAVNAKLDRFAANLHRLAKIDQLSSNQVNCFEALSGIYTSLVRLYSAQKKTASEFEIMCKQGGRPTAHAHGRIGVAIEYWSSEKQVSAGQTHEEMDVDKADDALLAEQGGSYRLHVEVESSPADLYPSLRVSDDWLPEPLELPAPDSGEAIPWQEPPPTVISIDGGDMDSMTVNGNQKLLDLRFVAKLEPPVVLPWQIANVVMQSCGLSGVQPFLNWPTWHSMLLNRELPHTGTATNAAVAVSSQPVLSFRNGEETEVTHTYSLDVAKPEIAVKLTELPFSHPRQLVETLPILRQWACFGTLVKDAFTIISPQATSAASSSKSQPTLADVLSSAPKQSPTSDALPVNAVLVTSPIPTLDLHFPAKGGTALANVSVQVLPNAEISISGHEGVEADDGRQIGDDSEAKKLARALSVCGDLSVWVEWLRTREG